LRAREGPASRPESNPPDGAIFIVRLAECEVRGFLPKSVPRLPLLHAGTAALNQDHKHNNEQNAGNDANQCISIHDKNLPFSA
jgi:hypothetical protein